MVSCEQVWREISNYLENDVEAGLRKEMDEHLQTCQRCKSLLEGTRNVIHLYGDERMIELPSGFGRRLERRLARNVSAGRRWSSWSAWMVPVAALLLIAGSLKFADSMTVSPSLKSEHAQPPHNIPPDMQVIVTADAKTFHAAGCPFIHNKATERTMTAQAAIAEGYAPCLRCMRKYLNTVVAHSDDDDEEDELNAEGGVKHAQENSARAVEARRLHP
ncbi:MAG TPA: zf-HC2 domain-containing protein [Candidatus Sulfotelmatobacter sp.]|nr:zf-HC2 domain-containing protein [Candidatus Sulfotelmatobacter sp.]